MPIPKEGNKAPEFTLPSGEGKEISLKDYRGKQRVVGIFIRRTTPRGCTVEACAFRDNIKKIEKKDAVVLGVSPDDLKSHDKFIGKFKLPFVLLSDTEKKVCEAYGVWVKKSMYGREYMAYLARSTFIIGKDGRIEKVYAKVKPEGHAEEVLGFLDHA